MCDCSRSSEAGRTLDRRGLLRTGAGVAAAGTLLRVDPASAARGRRTRRYVFEGAFSDPTTADWHYLPFRVPRGVRRIHVEYDHQPGSTPVGVGYNVVDIGIFDPSGHGVGDARGFRGWSGGARREFRLTRRRATPGYLAGPITPGEWHVILGPYQIVPPGTPYRVEVTLTFGRQPRRFRATPAPERVAGRGRGWYRGDLHTHTVHSDGRHTQRSLAALAQAAGLDILGSSEHNTSSATLTWGRHAPADLLVVNGEEVTTRSGHWLAMGLPPGTWVDWRYRAADDRLGRFVRRVHRRGGVAVVAHPWNPVPSIRWEHDADYAGMDAVELWNGPWTEDDRFAVAHWHAMLVAGRFVPGIGNSDTHHEGQLVGLPHTVYRMSSLSTRALVRAVRGGHCWIAESSGVQLSLTAALGGREATFGDRLGAGDGDLVDVRLVASGVPGTFAVLHGAAGPLGVAVADDGGELVLEVQVPAGIARFVRAEVGRPDGDVVAPNEGTPIAEMVALTNPVFLGRV